MPRMNAPLTERQAQREDALACLGNALVYLKLVDLRVRMAAANQPELLGPVCEDLTSAWELIRRAQGEMKGMTG